MKVLHVNDVANTAAAMVRALRTEGCDATLLRLRLAGGAMPLAVKLAALPARLVELTRACATARGGGFDAVHSHYAYLGIVGVAGSFPYVLHCHGTDIRLGLRSPLRRPLTMLALRSAAAVLFSTPDLSDAVTAVRPDASWMPNPVDTEAFSPRGPEGEGGRTRILVISNLHPLKGVGTAFEAISALARERDDFEVTAVDSGPERDRYLHTPGVRFVPPVPHDQMPALINAHDIVIGQLVIGSLGMCELESMACGKPVIVRYEPSRLYSAPPPVLPACSAEEVAFRLCQLLDDATLRAAAGAAGCSWVRNQHGMHEVARRLLAVYRGLA